MREKYRAPVRTSFYTRISTDEDHLKFSLRAQKGRLEAKVKIAVGPNGVFESGNVGALRRRAAAERVVSAVSAGRGKPKPPKDPQMPQVVELLRKALEWQTLLESGGAANQATIARREGITRTRATQVVGLLRLAPEIQQHIISMPATVRRPSITERTLRLIGRLDGYAQQVHGFEQLVGLP